MIRLLPWEYGVRNLFRRPSRTLLTLAGLTLVVLLVLIVVGFIRGNFDPDSDLPEFRSCIWRINVAADAQGAGIGKFAVVALAEEARSRGFDELTVIWEPGEEGPEEFFLKVGFEITGQTQYGENIGALDL